MAKHLQNISLSFFPSFSYHIDNEKLEEKKNITIFSFKMCKIILFGFVLLLITIFDTNSSPPAKDVFEALRHVCTGKFEGGSCPYAIAYDIATQLAGDWYHRDGADGLWSDGGFTLWWPSGVGLWAFAEFFHTMGGRSTFIKIDI
jgi:hypothetical protein